MKILFTTLLFCLIFGIGKGQGIYPIAEKIPVLDGNGNPISYGVAQLRSKIILLLKADKQTKSIHPFNQIPNDPLGSIVFLEGTKHVEVTTQVKTDSLSYYRYSIIENDTNTVVRDGLLSTLVGGAPGHLTMDLRIPEVTGKKITVKIYRLPEADKVTTLIIYNKPFERIRILKKYLVSDGQISKKKQRNAVAIGEYPNIHVDERTKAIVLSLQKTDLDFAYQVYVFNNIDKKKLKYYSVPNSKWDYNTLDGNPLIVIDKSYFSELGDYEIKIIPDPYLAGYRYGLEPSAHIINSKGQMSFHVSSVPGVFSIRETGIIALIILITVSCVALLIIGFNKKKARKKVMLAQFNTEAAKGELDQIRSQLNPHFVYNSLSGIQNLMNQKEVEKANAYLSKFARLTRNILDEREQISLQDEHMLLDDFLAMERLRFKFTYEIRMVESINLLQVEIPAMLLQPFVENAIKHSMSAMRDKGNLLIEFTSKDKDLILSVKDNGKGFDVQKDHGGLGLKLCRKRIDLLNKVYKECPVSLVIDSGNSGTAVVITLNNWL